jgi:hypothetical protein
VQRAPSPVGDGLQVLVYTPDRPDLFARICGYFDSAGFSIQDAKVHTTRAGYALDTFQVVHTSSAAWTTESRLPRPDLAGRDPAAQALARRPAARARSRGRVSRRVKSFPVTPRITLRPTNAPSAGCSPSAASDRSGLLYAIARVLARHHINLQLAKISTLGERWKTPSWSTARLQHNRTQIAIESELLDAALDPARPVWVESESRRIGQLHLPEALIERMRTHGRCVMLQMPDAARVELLLEEYGFYAQQVERFCGHLDALIDLRGKATVAAWQAQARAGDWAGLFADLMQRHYDPLYLRSTERNFAGAAQALQLDLRDGHPDTLARAAADLVAREG